MYGNTHIAKAKPLLNFPGFAETMYFRVWLVAPGTYVHGTAFVCQFPPSKQIIK